MDPGIWIRIQELQKCGSNADPYVKPCITMFCVISGSSESNSTEGSDTLGSPSNSQQLAGPPNNPASEQVEFV